MYKNTLVFLSCLFFVFNNGITQFSESKLIDQFQTRSDIVIGHFNEDDVLDIFSAESVHYQFVDNMEFIPKQQLGKAAKALVKVFAGGRERVVSIEDESLSIYSWDDSSNEFIKSVFYNSFRAKVQPEDLNQDGHDDLLVYHKFDEDVMIFFYDPQLDTYADPVGFDLSALDFLSNPFIETIDVDMDGTIDLICNASGGIHWWRNISNASDFEYQDAIPNLEFTGSSIKVHDFNNDGFEDILSYWAQYGNDHVFVRLLLRNADGSFQPEYDLGLTTQFTIDRVFFSDINGDGYLDILATDADHHFTYGVSYNLKNGEFSPFNRMSYYEGGSTIDFYDIDENGEVEIFFSNFQGVYLFANANSQIEQEDSYWLEAASNYAIGDVNDDGQIDIISSLGKNSSGNLSDIHIGYGNENGFKAPRFFNTDQACTDFNVQQTFLLDYDDDGDKDFFHVGEGIEVYNDEGATDGKFSSGARISEAATDAVIHGDINSDNRTDLIYNHNNKVFSLTQTASNDWSGPNDLFETSDFGLTLPRQIVDLDNDGDQDLLFHEDPESRELVLATNTDNGNAWQLDSLSFADTIYQFFYAFEYLELNAGDEPGLLASVGISNNGPAAIRLYAYDKDSFHFHSPQEIFELPDQEKYSIKAVNDFDQDGDLDIFLTKAFERELIWYRNDGGNFVNYKYWDFGFNQIDELFFEDVNGDNQKDILFSRAGHISYRLTDQDFNLSVVTTISSNDNFGFDQYHDLDGDSDLDRIRYRNEQVIWQENEGLGNFSSDRQFSNEPLSIEFSFSNKKFFAVNDFDKDGDLDVAVNGHPSNNQHGTLFLNAGGGDFTQTISIENVNLDATDLIIGDIDMDGFEDILANDHNSLRWISNQLTTSNNFSSENIIDGNFGAIREAVIVDWDNDGDNDIMYKQGEVCFGLENINGLGNFAPAQLIVENLFANFPLTIVDLDLDGFPDVVFATLDKEKIHLLSGKGNFTANSNTQEILQFVHWRISAGFADYFDVIDFNGDGNLDIMFTTYWAPGLDGDLAFSAPIILGYFSNSYNFDFLDLDEDGQLEILSDQGITESVSNWNDDSYGTSRIIDYTGGVGQFHELQSADINLDNFPDLIFSNFTFTSSYMNSMADGTKDFDLREVLLTNNLTDYTYIRVANLFGGPESEVYILTDDELLYSEISADGIMESPKVIDQFSVPQLSFFIEDIDGDGKKDLLTHWHGVVKIFYNNSTSTLELEKVEMGFGNLFDAEIRLYDMDNDGDMDLFFTKNQFSSFAENLGNRTFETDHHQYSDKYTRHEPFDINDDGYFDYAYNKGGVQDLIIGINDGTNENFDEILIFNTSFTNWLSKISVSDLDQDGKKDVLLVRESGTEILLFRQTADLEFSDRIDLQDSVAGIRTSWHILEDVDLDGDQDLVLLGEDPLDLPNNIKLVWQENLSNNPRLTVSFFYDQNQNGIQDSSESVIQNQAIKLSPEEIINYSNPNGEVTYLLDDGDYTAEVIETELWTVTTGNQEFSFSIDSTTNNLEEEVGLAPKIDSVGLELFTIASAFRCNETVFFWANILNTGSLPYSGTLKMHVDPLATNLELFPAADTVINDSLTWYFTSLIPTNNFVITGQFSAPGVMNVGDEMILRATATLDPTGIPNGSQLHYQDEYIGEVGCAIDPNDKMVFPAGEGMENYTLFSSELTYVVRFQNVGNAYARNVIIRDTLDSNLDVNTFRPIAASHPYVLTRTDNILEFKFNDIFLPDSLSNEAASHGFIAFNIRPNENLPENTAVENTANIYFDFNSEISTNTTNNTLVSVIPTSVLNLAKANEYKFIVFPNPTERGISIRNESKVSTNSFELYLYYLDGRLCVKKEMEQQLVKMDLTNVAAGSYILKVVDTALGRNVYMKLIAKIR